MRPMTRAAELLIATSMAVVFVAIIVVLATNAIADGFRIKGMFPPGASTAQLPLSAALLFLLISATDWPAAIRKSRLIRVQFQCWGVWELFVGLLFGPLSSFRLGNFIFIVGAFLLAAYSLVALFRPRDFPGVERPRIDPEPT